MEWTCSWQAVKYHTRYRTLALFDSINRCMQNAGVSTESSYETATLFMLITRCFITLLHTA